MQSKVRGFWCVRVCVRGSIKYATAVSDPIYSIKDQTAGPHSIPWITRHHLYHVFFSLQNNIAVQNSRASHLHF